MDADYYQVLGVEPKATARAVKRAYLKLARREHPDLNPGDRGAQARFALIQEAYRVLSQRDLREEYDRRGRRPAAPAEAAKPPRARAGAGRARIWEQVLRDVFQEPEAPERAMAPARGEDVHQLLELTFEEAMRGASREVRYQREGPCPECRGRRWAPGALVEPCRQCGGKGVVEVPHGPWTVHRICPSCAGEGETGTPACRTCRGAGRLPVLENRTVKVPAGSASGARIVVPGAGQPGRRGGDYGDLVATCKVQAHPVLERKGHNLYCTVPVSLAEAVLGGAVHVPTLAGRTALRLPPGTQCGQQFTLRGKGVPAPEGRGDLYVTVQLTVPSGEDPRVRRLFQELEKILAEKGRTS